MSILTLTDGTYAVLWNDTTYRTVGPVVQSAHPEQFLGRVRDRARELDLELARATFDQVDQIVGELQADEIREDVAHDLAEAARAEMRREGLTPGKALGIVVDRERVTGDVILRAYELLGAVA